MRIKNRLPAVEISADWQETFNDFLLQKKRDNCRERTLYDYQRHIGVFFRKYPNAWQSEQSLRKCISEHFISLTEKSPGTYNIALRYLRSFFNWCVNEAKILSKNPTDGIKKQREPEEIRWLERDIVEKLIDLPNQKTYLGLRDYALILFQLDTGARPNEALQLQLEHFNFTRNEVTIPYHIAKTKRPRTLIISPDTSRAIRKLVSYRLQEWGEKAPVFCNRDGRAMRSTSWAHRMHYLYSCKLPVEVTPYSLRHTFAILYLRNGGSLESLRDILGHTTFEMVMRYAKLAKCDLHTQHEKASPVMQIMAEKKRYRAPNKLKKN